MYSYEWRKFLTENQKQEIRETFSIFDRTNSNRLEFSNLKPALRALGFDFTPEDIERMLYNIKKQESDKEYLNVENFLDLIGMRMVNFMYLIFLIFKRNQEIVLMSIERYIISPQKIIIKRK